MIEALNQSWVIYCDVKWLLSWEEFAVDTFVLFKQVEGRVLIFSPSVILYFIKHFLSIIFELDESLFSEIWGMYSELFYKEFFSSFPATCFWRILKCQQDIEMFYVDVCQIQHHVNQWPFSVWCN